jgi:hypothetical protein
MKLERNSKKSCVDPDPKSEDLLETNGKNQMGEIRK